jgi:transposase-like protein
MAKHFVIDPASGEQVSLCELADRHGINVSTIRNRHWLGMRGWELVKACRSWREWNGPELAFLDKHYPAGMPVEAIAEHVGHSVIAVMRRADIRNLKRPKNFTEQSVKRFEELRGKRLEEIAREYQQRRLSRNELARDVGVCHESLKARLPHELWQSWPHNTVGRQLACEQRRA